ncbi:MAG TPA: ParB/RepB/Spo0J family partition protein [Chloroflexi bacterium]|nr:ParB/RepB/Spo0J family partition protein [Chloroflexota bacterium]HPO57943.1 ParB/RepB/Spo0J family partition protein [Anaerolineaceae bacterium]
MARKSGLGKGLEALIPGDSLTAGQDSVLQVPVERIVPNPQQPRLEMNEDDLQELAASIQEHGILQPLVVSRTDAAGEYTLIAGERRLRAARLAGLRTVPVIVRTASEQQRLELALIENVQRADLSPLETAAAYNMLAEDFGLSHEDIARRVGKSRVAVTNALRLLKLAPKARQALEKGLISEGHARALLGLNLPAAQESALATVIKNELNVRQTEELVRKLNGQRPERKPAPAPAPEVTDLEERLQQRLGTRVNLKPSKKGGRVIIHYYSDEDLESLLNHLLREE